MSDRVIKFRVWDQTEKVWQRGCSIGQDGCSFSEGGKERGSWIIQFYTGLLDKDGKEIYEGDYVRFKDNQYLVEYANGSFWVGGQTTLGKAMLEGGVLVTCNIFENPDLLE